MLRLSLNIYNLLRNAALCSGEVSLSKCLALLIRHVVQCCKLAGMVRKKWCSLQRVAAEIDDSGSTKL